MKNANLCAFCNSQIAGTSQKMAERLPNSHRIQMQALTQLDPIVKRCTATGRGTPQPHHTGTQPFLQVLGVIHHRPWRTTQEGETLIRALCCGKPTHTYLMSRSAHITGTREGNLKEIKSKTKQIDNRTEKGEGGRARSNASALTMQEAA